MPSLLRIFCIRFHDRPPHEYICKLILWLCTWSANLPFFTSVLANRVTRWDDHSERYPVNLVCISHICWCIFFFFFLVTFFDFFERFSEYNMLRFTKSGNIFWFGCSSFLNSQFAYASFLMYLDTCSWQYFVLTWYDTDRLLDTHRIFKKKKMLCQTWM